ncbi:hypothetical protein [Gordonia sp. DT101]|uniref:hypothetical protein n=1 Tax=Gordonia sp. DT101 TaxID=3416545 RepID=UPI003CFA9DE3
MTAPTIDPGDQEQAEQKPARLTTGVLVDCPCGASGVPMAWSAAGKNDTVRLYRHLVGRAYDRHEVAGGGVIRGRRKCGGPDDLFLHMLRNGGLARTDLGRRLMTDAEMIERDVVEQLWHDSDHEDDDLAAAHAEGMLF